MNEDNYCKKTFFSFVMCKREFVSDKMKSLLENPDIFLNDEKTRIIQNNFKSKIGVVLIAGRKIVIKRHNYKSQWHKCKRFFRQTRAGRNWYFSHLLISHGFLIPKPVAFVETRIGFLRGKSYFMYEYVDGITGEKYFKKYADSPEKIKCAINSIMKLIASIKDLGWIHGDIRGSNFIFKNDELWLLDFDDMRPRSWYDQEAGTSWLVSKTEIFVALKKIFFIILHQRFRNNFLIDLICFEGLFLGNF
jgi:serine/threonine protein kinase